MKINKYKLIKLSQKTYERLENLRFENNNANLEEAIEDLLDYYYEDDEKEEWDYMW